ncbi:hypothetical protein Aduo_018549 [Ancylostoma duodenale]
MSDSGSDDGSNSYDLDLDAIYMMNRIDCIYNILDDIMHRLETIETLLRQYVMENDQRTDFNRKLRK